MHFEHIDEEERISRAIGIYRRSLNAPFYKQKYQGIAPPSDAESWQSLPMLTHAEMLDIAFPRSTDMLTTALRGMMVVSTGGSTGTARYALLTHEEWDLFADVQARSFKLMGIAPEDRVANLFVAGHLWPSFLGVHEIIKKTGAIHLPISSNISVEEIMRLCVEFDPDVMLSLPTMFVLLADIAIRDHIHLPSLRLIGYSGEQMSVQAQQHVRSALGVKEIRSLAYSSSDCGLMGYQCGRCGFGTYHVPTDFQYIEVVDPLTGRCLPDGEEGELLITNLGRTSMPIVRYLIGDVGTLLKEPCDCGDRNPLFRLAGRSGEDFKLGGGFISMNDFEESIGIFSGSISMNFMVEIEDIANQVELRLTIESSDPDAARKTTEALREEIETRITEIPVGLKMNYIKNFDIRIVPLNTLPRNPNTGKVRKLYDHRVQNN
jgi:phenylacetate-CoA ligase